MKNILTAVWSADGSYFARAHTDGKPAVDVRSLVPDVAAHVARALAGQSFSIPYVLEDERGTCSFAPLTDDGGHVRGVVANVTSVSRHEDVLRERLAFEELVTDLSTRFVTLSADDLNRELTQALGTIGEFSGVDRAYIFRFTEDRRAMDNTHEWCAGGIEPQLEDLQGLTVETLPWWIERLKARQVILVENVDDLPPEAETEKGILRAQDIQSVLVLPMICEDSVVGFVGFDSVRTRKVWPKKDIALLRIAGEIFVSAIERARTDDERRRLETQLIQARSLENVARLAGGVAHDFNNLLAVILNYATLLRRHLTDTSQLDKVDELFDAARRAADLTRQLLLMGRRDVVEPMLLDLGSVVTSLHPLLRRTLGEAIELRLRLADDLGIVRLGLPQIEQVILNLTLNARDAMPNGGVVLVQTENVDISPERARAFIDLQPGRYVQLQVIDDGEGMSQDVAARAFEPFFTTKGAGGTGLGLSTVHGIVRRVGGLITISTRQGLGTTVEILLPVVAHATEADVGIRPPPASSPSGRGETILVVDDSPAVRKLVCTMLSDNRYRAVEAANAQAAIAVCARKDVVIDLLLTDVIMPQMSGRQLAARLRDSFGIHHVLYMSGYDDEVVARQGVLEEGVVLLQKPFLEGDLLRAVRAVLDNDRSTNARVTA